VVFGPKKRLSFGLLGKTAFSSYNEVYDVFGNIVQLDELNKIIQKNLHICYETSKLQLIKNVKKHVFCVFGPEVIQNECL